jgi:SAM-dependent methyltransferase
MSDSEAYDRLDIVANRLFGCGGMPEPRLALAEGMVEFYKTPARVVTALVKRVEWRAEDVFFDLGSGLGQVVLMVHLLAGVRAVGVEIEPAFCEYARRSAARLGLAGVEFVEGDLREADLSAGTVFFLYTPMRGARFGELLARLEDIARLRKILVIGWGPCVEELSRVEWLKTGDGRVSGSEGVRNGGGEDGLSVYFS